MTGTQYKQRLASVFFICVFSASPIHVHAQESETGVVENVIQIIEQKEASTPETPSVLDERRNKDSVANKNPFSITQHRSNYLLPLTHVSNPNNITIDGLPEEAIDELEAKFQISIKTPIFLKDDGNTGLFFGFTTTSFWQVYNSEASKPFRETNYEPEVFYQWQADWDIFGYRFNLAQIGFNHHSNGQDGLKSRSWNRVVATALFSDKDTAYYLKTWWRLPEDDKTDPLDPTGDDNPDINDFYGRAELGFVKQLGKVNLLARWRNNLSFGDNRSGLELNFTYPLTKRYDLLLQYFNGYGDSLIDYNRHQQRFGLGVQLRIL
ncbi:phospholipase A [Agaribacter flavus]|uniref:Phospholipase A1 n=1 Tax=Agaribacter flavus TaxID=1902781 RepID=A0ABV7FPB2_9ALTE